MSLFHSAISTNMSLDLRKISNMTIFALVALFYFQCASERDALKITNFYNSDLNGNVIQTLGEGRIHWQMKYLLDTIIDKNVKKNDGDTKYCVFEFFDFSYSGTAIYIDSDDTISYRLTELNGSNASAGAFTARFSIGDSLHLVRYVIKAQKLNGINISNRCDFKSFFLKKTCNPMDLRVGDDGPSINTVLKFWKERNGSLTIEFYDHYGLNFYPEPNKIRNVQAGDSSKPFKMKIKFLN